MSSFPERKIQTFLAGGTIVEGHAVKLSDENTVVECTAATDRTIGWAQHGASSGKSVEVAMPGGGAKIKLSDTVTVGKFVSSTTDGTAIRVGNASDVVAAQVLESGVSGDMVQAQVLIFQATAAQS